MTVNALHQDPHVSSEAILLEAIAAAPVGLSRDWIWEGGRGGWSGAFGEAWRACRSAGLTVERGDRFFLTEAGAVRLGIADYRARDTSGWPPEDAERFYLQGYCHVLALALHRMTGWPLVAALRPDGAPLHVFVEDEGGDPWDVDGRTSRARIQEDCGLGRILFRSFPDEAAVHALTGGHDRMRDFDEEDVRIAGRFVSAHPDRFPMARDAGPEEPAGP
ncbi:hypothetical protein LAZ40_03255 [Cereibacter sphaeroides]|uniref:hypothetical protein n=1 Tax=Cereibacter sphaeroides TaxID=1063 RepID=UPI001F2DB736|nr:hypothetical protein [Cereibacter sphaeroides]MCE6958073.1 hypothetical protein [Cereibacter sphaeroides]MCE6971316.1 hypothetical protein [Cereibacter sphaeroides]